MTAPTADPLDAEIAAYKSMREQLETEHLGKWVVFHDGNPVGFFDTFEEADRRSTEQFDRAAMPDPQDRGRPACPAELTVASASCQHPQRALIDTDASDCCVDIDLAEQLQLKKATGTRSPA